MLQNMVSSEVHILSPELAEGNPVNDTRHVTHYELDARLSATEARMDARIDRIEIIVENIEKTTDAARREFRGIALALMLAMIAAVFSMWQINSSLISGTVSAMQHGINTSEHNQSLLKSVNEAVVEIRESRKEIAAMQEKRR